MYLWPNGAASTRKKISSPARWVRSDCSLGVTSVTEAHKVPGTEERKLPKNIYGREGYPVSGQLVISALLLGEVFARGVPLGCGRHRRAIKRDYVRVSPRPNAEARVASAAVVDRTLQRGSPAQGSRLSFTP